MRPAYFTVAPEVDADGLVAGKILTAGTVTLTGALISDGMWIAPDQTGQLLTVTSTAAETLAITVTGTDVDGKAATDTITLTAATVAVGDIHLSKVTAISTSTISVGTITIGLLGEACSPTFVLNYRAQNFKTALAVIPTGTINGTVEHTFDNVYGATWTESTGTWFNHDDTALVNFTAKQDGNYDFPPIATRVLVNSASASATVQYVIVCPD